MTRLLDGRPDRTLSRLVCGRVLAPDTDYLACVVPTFELGRLAGLGLDVTAGEEEQAAAGVDARRRARRPSSCPSTTRGSSPPAPNGDFQSLAMLLRARPLPTGVGERPIDVSASGVGVPCPPARRCRSAARCARSRVVERTRRRRRPPSPWPAREELHDAVPRRARRRSSTPPTRCPPTSRCSPRPATARRSRASGALDPARRDRWYEQLNLEPPARATAQFGTRLVQEQQEALVAVGVGAGRRARAGEHGAAPRPVRRGARRRACTAATCRDDGARRRAAGARPGAGPARRSAPRPTGPDTGSSRCWHAAQVPAGRVRHGDAPGRPPAGRDPPRRPVPSGVAAPTRPSPVPCAPPVGRCCQPAAGRRARSHRRRHRSIVGHPIDGWSRSNGWRSACCPSAPTSPGSRPAPRRSPAHRRAPASSCSRSHRRARPVPADRRRSGAADRSSTRADVAPTPAPPAPFPSDP